MAIKDYNEESWPANLVVRHSTLASISYPNDTNSENDTNNNNYIFSRTEMSVVRQQNNIVPVWDATACEVIVQMDNAGVDWAAVECFECRIPHGATETVMVITLYTMPSINASIVELIISIHHSTGCRIEMRIGHVGGQDRDTPSTKKCNGAEYLPPGSRASFRKEFNTPIERTSGGIVEVVDSSGANKGICLLSCGPALCPEDIQSCTDIDISSGLLRQPLQRYGTINCAYPSELLCQDYYKQLIDDIKSAEKEIKSLEHEIEVLEQFSTENLYSLKVAFGEMRSQKKHLTEALEDTIEGADLRIGIVCASSGNRIVLKHHLDWVLVLLNEYARSRLKKPNTMQNVMLRHSGQVHLSPKGHESLKPGSTVYLAHHAELTSGSINVTKSYLRLRDGCRCEKWAVVPDRMYSAFGNPSDCGVWVVSRVSNFLAGVLCAVNTTTKVGYVVPIRDVFEDISRDTGYNVRLPSF